MSIVTVEDTNLTNIADAIRGKNGTSDTYKPNEMANAISNITTNEDLSTEFDEQNVLLTNQETTLEEIVGALNGKAGSGSSEATIDFWFDEDVLHINMKKYAEISDFFNVVWGNTQGVIVENCNTGEIFFEITLDGGPDELVVDLAEIPDCEDIYIYDGDYILDIHILKENGVYAFTYFAIGLTGNG